MKLANPLHYPLAVLVGGVFLIIGARIARLPVLATVPSAMIVTTLGATILKSHESNVIEVNNPALARELQALRQRALTLGEKADSLKAEATALLTSVNQVELLGMVQYACDQSQELPGKIDHLTTRIQGKEALLSTQELEKQLKGVAAKINASSGIARDQWIKLARRLEQNITLAREGEDTRQAQLAHLSTLIAEAGGVLQKLQNKLRTEDLTSDATTAELRNLSIEFKGVQENVDVLTA